MPPGQNRSLPSFLTARKSPAIASRINSSTVQEGVKGRPRIFPDCPGFQRYGFVFSGLPRTRPVIHVGMMKGGIRHAG
jgi:hypothetical protein